MGDVSHLMPAIHPFVGGVTGSLHARDFEVSDYYAACVLPAKIMAMTIVDLLGNKAQKAHTILNIHRPLLTKEQYIKILNNYFN